MSEASSNFQLGGGERQTSEPSGRTAQPELLPPLDLQTLSEVNAQRTCHWHGDDWRSPDDSWTLADWSNAMAGEAGEAANIVKKIRRIQTLHWERQRYPGDSLTSIGELAGDEALPLLIEKLADELADIVLYTDLLATKAGIDLSSAIRRKFNRVSEKQGFPERL